MQTYLTMQKGWQQSKELTLRNQKYWMPSHRNSERRDIHIRFVNKQTKFNLYSSEKKRVQLNELGIHETGDPSIYIQDVLTQKQNQLAYLARKKRTELKWRGCWWLGGKLYMRKDEKSDKIHIASEKDLQKLSN
eukprot:Lithocolla_globosa_v1_NODE_3766_length_1586_cov_8.849118.p2 type:complete len:134 gc:universal NODE_3766_length_1586_cov_8.849118:1285-884(-)